MVQQGCLSVTTYFTMVGAASALTEISNAFLFIDYCSKLTLS
jgi:hypothetical protein